ncbi:MAG TPA: hypothetical protein VF593_13670 [Chthoniobacteraceae bacterium]
MPHKPRSSAALAVARAAEAAVDAGKIWRRESGVRGFLPHGQLQ